MPINILNMAGVQPELRRALGEVGSLAVPCVTPVNAVASRAVLAVADIAIIGNGDTVTFLGVTGEKAAAPAAGKWDNAAALAAILNTAAGWGVAENAGVVTATADLRGAAANGEVITVEILEDTTAGGDGAGAKATGTIAAATIARLANGDTVSFAGSLFTKAAATSAPAGKFADQAGLIACIDALDDWAAADKAGAVDITAATDAVAFNGEKVEITLYRASTTGADGTPAFAGAVCVDAGFIYVCTATDTTAANNNWERAAIAAF